MWIYLGLLAALFLGLYNLCKKVSVKENAVLPVLWCTTSTTSLCMIPFVLISHFKPELLNSDLFLIQSLSTADHAFLFSKSMLMTASWLLSFYALKHLPITIVAPIRSSGPFFTLLGAVFIYHERPNLAQWAGFFLIISAMMLYSKVGKKEGLDFKRNKWIFAIVFATILGASSGLYDKFLIQNRNLNAQTVLAWSAIYVSLILSFVLAIVYLPKQKEKLQWRWSIPCVGLLLVFADFFYFRALQDPEAMIMILSAIKRSQLLITVFVGGWFFKEKNRRKKLIPLSLMILGIALILYSK